MHLMMLANDDMTSLMPQCQENEYFVHIFSKQPYFIFIVNSKFWHYHEDKNDGHNRVCSLM